LKRKVPYKKLEHKTIFVREVILKRQINLAINFPIQLVFENKLQWDSLILNLNAEELDNMLI